jgi:phage-related protein
LAIVAHTALLRWTKYSSFAIVCLMHPCKPIVFCGTALKDLKAFPKAVMHDIGEQLSHLQHGEDADDWKPMTTVGKGVREVRGKDESGAYRALYVAKYKEAIYVLHCFLKKTAQTSQADIDLAATRLRTVLQERKT